MTDETRAKLSAWAASLRDTGRLGELAPAEHDGRVPVGPFEIEVDGRRCVVDAIERRGDVLVMHGRQVIDTIVLTVTIGEGT